MTEFEKENLGLLLGIGNVISDFKSVFEKNLDEQEAKQTSMESAWLHIEQGISNSIRVQTEVLSLHLENLTDWLIEATKPTQTDSPGIGSTKMPKNLDDLKNAGSSLGLLGKGISELAIGLFDISKSFIFLNPVSIKLGQLATNGIVGILETFAAIDQKTVENANKSAESLKNLSLGIVSIAGTFVLVSFATAIIDWESILYFTLGVAAVITTFSLLSLGVEKITKGRGLTGLSMDMAFLGLGITSLALSLALISNLPINYGNAALFGLVIGGIILAFSAIDVLIKMMGGGGLEQLSKDMMWLSLGIASLGLSLALVTNLPIKYENVIPLGLTVAGLALVFTLIGKVGSQVLMGSLVVGAMSLSLLLFSYSIQEAMKIRIEWEKLGEIGLAIAGLAAEFALIGNPLTLPFMIAGAVGVGAIGLSMISIAEGIIKWNELVDSKIPIDEISQKLSSFLSAITQPFAAIGKSKDNDTSLMGMVFGLDFSQNHVEAGIKAVMDLGDAMKSMAQGIISWNSSEMAAIDSVSYSNEFGSWTGPAAIGNKLADFVRSITEPFAAIGKTKSGDTSLMGMVFGSDFSQTDVETGIESVMNLGDAMKSISSGIISWTGEEMKQVESYQFVSTSLDGKTTTWTGVQAVAMAVGSILTTFRTPLAELGKVSDGGNSSLFKMITGADLSQTDVERGIETASKLGDIVADISGGIKIFMENSVDVEEAKKKISGILLAVPYSLSEIQKAYPEFNKVDPKDNNALLSLEFITKKVMMPLTKNFSKFDKVANSIKSIATSYGTIAKHIDSIKDSFNKIEVDTIKSMSEMFYNGDEFIKSFSESSRDTDLLDSLVGIFSNSDEESSNNSQIVSNTNNTRENNSQNSINTITGKTEALMDSLLKQIGVLIQDTRTNTAILQTIAKNTRDLS